MERFKFYKLGKFWLVVGLIFFLFLGGFVFNDINVYVDVINVMIILFLVVSMVFSVSVVMSFVVSDEMIKVILVLLSVVI